MQTVPEGKIYFASGKSRSGKSEYISQLIKDKRRLLIWDKKGEHQADIQVGTIDELKLVIEKYQEKAGRIALVRAPIEAFEEFCACAFRWACYGYVSNYASAVFVEELGRVTGPAKASPMWGQLVSEGLVYGLSIYAVAQRPAEIDKTILGQASFVHCCKMTWEQDERYIAGLMRVPIEVVTGLQVVHENDDGSGHLRVSEYLERNIDTGVTHKGQLTFENNKPVFKEVPLSNPGKSPEIPESNLP